MHAVAAGPGESRGPRRRCALVPRSLPTVLVGAVALTLAGCSGDSPRAEPSSSYAAIQGLDRSSPAAPGGTSGVDAASQQSFDDRVRAQLGQDVVVYGLRVLAQEKPIIVSTVTFETASGGSFVDGRLQLRGRGLSRVEESFTLDGVWLRLPAWRPPRHGCWLDLTGQVRATTPALVTLLPQVTIVAGVGSSLSGQLPAAKAMRLFPASVRDHLPLGPEAGRVAVPVAVSLAGEGVDRVVLDGAEVSAALSSAGVPVRTATLQALRGFRSENRFLPTASAHPVVVPPPESVISGKGCARPDLG